MKRQGIGPNLPRFYYSTAGGEGLTPTLTLPLRGRGFWGLGETARKPGTGRPAGRIGRCRGLAFRAENRVAEDSRRGRRKSVRDAAFGAAAHWDVIGAPIAVFGRLGPSVGIRFPPRPAMLGVGLWRFPSVLGRHYTLLGVNTGWPRLGFPVGSVFGVFLPGLGFRGFLIGLPLLGFLFGLPLVASWVEF